MLMFPLEFVPVKYPGYAWNVKEQRLYTFKLGSLRPLPVRMPCMWNNMAPAHYTVSHLGRKRHLLVSDLKKLTQGYEVQTVPVLAGKQLSLFN